MSSKFVPPYPETWGSGVVNATEWSAELTAYGTGESTKAVLEEIEARRAVSESALEHLTSTVVHQCTLFPVAEPVLRFLLPLCIDDQNLRASLHSFWEEWLEGIDLIEIGEAPSTEELASAREKVRAAACEDDVDVLWDDPDNGPIGVLMRHTIASGQLCREIVLSMIA